VEVSPAKDKVKINKRPVPLNDTAPLWTKHPNECSKEDYIEFYRKVFMDYKEPLFWIHLNMDYPFNLKGILYFPKINTEYDSIEGTIKLYNNQVFIADNIKEVIPEFLMVLKGVIDCPDLPLNVSRSALQNDGFVNKIAEYISKKVADKLSGMCKTDKENYEKYWDDISPFIKFGCLKDEKFCDKMMDYMLFKNLDHKYLTLKECVEKNGGELKDPKAEAEESAGSGENPAEEEEKKTTVFYVTDEQQQSQYINLFRAQEQDAVILNHNIDSPFITQLEQRNQNIKFQRIDADVNESAREEITEDEKEAFQKKAEELTEIFRKELGNEKLEIKVEKIKDENVASIITLSEESRRMQEMMRMYSMGGGMDPSMFGSTGTLVLNANHPLVQYVAEHKESEKSGIFCKQLYDLAMLAHKPLSPEEMTAFVRRSNEIMLKLAE
jgi:molecular chaperone HtpG